MCHSLHLLLTLIAATAVTGYYASDCNGYPHAVAVRCVFEGGKIVAGTLPPKSSLVQREEGLILQTLTISLLSGSLLATYTATDFKNRIPPGEKGQFWLVSTNGLTRISTEDFKLCPSSTL